MGRSAQDKARQLELIQAYLEFYRDFLNSDLEGLRSLYHSDVSFTDPIVSVQGIDSMINYFESSKDGLKHCKFEFADTIEAGDSACMTWEMKFAHEKLAGGREVVLPGTSFLKFDSGLCTQHTDYYDMGAMLYEHVPILGSFIKWLKAKV